MLTCEWALGAPSSGNSLGPLRDAQFPHTSISSTLRLHVCKQVKYTQNKPDLTWYLRPVHSGNQGPEILSTVNQGSYTSRRSKCHHFFLLIIHDLFPNFEGPYNPMDAFEDGDGKTRRNEKIEEGFL